MANIDFDVLLASRGIPSPLPAGTVKPYKIAIFGDSYVADTGPTSPKSFGYTLAAALRLRYGDAGAGYCPIFSASGSVVASVSIDGTVPQYGPWTDPRRTMAAGGLASTMTGGIGVSDTNAIAFTPNVNDSYGRGVADTLTTARLYYTLRSTAPRPAFIIKQNDQASSVASATIVSSGAAFNGTIASGTLTAIDGFSGLIPRGGGSISGAGVTAGTYLAIGSAYGATTAGGAGTYPLNQASTVASSTAMTATAQEPVALDTIQTVMHRFLNTSNNNCFITNMNGDLLIHGIESFNGQKGVTVSQIGYGGVSAFQYACLDDATQRKFWQTAAFDLVIVVLGHNGKDYFGPDAFGNHMATIISRIQANPTSKIILVRQIDSSSSLTTYHPQYDAVYQQLARAYGCGYYDERSASPSLANYATALAAGLMLDGTHGNAAANTIIGNDLASKIFVPIAAA